MLTKTNMAQLEQVINAAKKVAKRYRELTGKPLGIAGEVGEFQAAKLLNLQLLEARHPGNDAIGPDGRLIQIKSRCVLPSSRRSQRVPRINLKYDWNTVLLILMNEDFDPIAIYEAERSDIKRELSRPGSKSRNERGSLSVSKFKAISKCVWGSG